MTFILQGDTNIPALAMLLSDSSRCRLLLALADGRTLSASVLAAEAGVAPSTASEHLGKLLAADLLAVEVRGRHRFYRLSGPKVAQLLEMLMEHAPRAPIRSLREGTRAHALRQARYCYDHLAGRLGVSLMDALLESGVLIRVHPKLASSRGATDRASEGTRQAVAYQLSGSGEEWMRDFGIDLEKPRGRRPLIRHCYDWSEQRYHLAGALGQALAQRLFALGWLVSTKQARVVRITDAGTEALRANFGIELEASA